MALLAGFAAWNAIRLFDSMDVPADVITCSTLMSACGKGSAWRVALAILDPWTAKLREVIPFGKQSMNIDFFNKEFHLEIANFQYPC